MPGGGKCGGPVLRAARKAHLANPALAANRALDEAAEGADLAEFDFAPGPGLVERADPGPVIDQAFNPTVRRLINLRLPTIAAVNGVAAGGGFSLAMAGDMIVAARSARFIQVFSRIALVPDLGSTWLLPRLVGRQRALELMMTNEPLTADLAKEWGLVREVFDRRERGSIRQSIDWA
mgnify:CR=1 FL=1